MRFAVFPLLAAALHAQAPVRLQVECTPEDVRQLDLDCTAQRPCPIYLEIAAVEPIGEKLFVTGNLHTTDATLFSVLLASRDRGVTWSEPHERIPGATLDQIQFIDHDHGWISGQKVQFAPHDPFLLITTDGGETWRLRPIVDEPNRKGAITRFWFKSRTTGALLVDRMHASEEGARHELYESMTGGESWTMLRASADPIPIDAPENRHPDWRVRADAATKSYHVETRETGAWKTIAKFAIEPGECAPAEPATEEAAPPEPAQPAEPAPAKERPPAKPPSLKHPRRD